MPTDENDAAEFRTASAAAGKTLALRLLCDLDTDLVADLQLSAEQEAFAGGACVEILQSWRTSVHRRSAHPFAVLDGDTVVGFFLLREFHALPAWADGDVLTMHNFRIGHEYQGRGCARRTMELCVQWATCHRPKARRLMLAVNVGNEAASRFYRRFGFQETGLRLDGPLGKQSVLSIDLRG